MNTLMVAELTEDDTGTSPVADDIATLPEAHPPTWTLKDTRTLLLPSGGAELMILLACPEEIAGPFRAQGEQTVNELRESIRTVALDLPEAEAIRDIQRQIRRAEDSQERCNENLRIASEQARTLFADGADLADGLAELARQETDAKAQLDLLASALPKLREELQTRTQAFRRAAADLAGRQRLATLEKATAEESNLAGILEQAADRLGRMIVAAFVTGGTRSSMMDDAIAASLAQELSPPMPPRQSEPVANPFAPRAVAMFPSAFIKAG